jgi:hypothetical protein
MLNGKKVTDLTLRLCNVKQVGLSRLLGAKLASSLNQIAKLFGKVNVAFARFGSRKLKAD